MGKKFGGNSRTKEDDYIKKILSENDKFFRYEINLIYKAFKLTLKYFLDNCIEFSVNDFFSFIKFHKKECKMYIRYRDQYEVIPEHDDMKMKVSKRFKDYLNIRGDFANVRRRQMLPDDVKRNKKMYRS